MNNYTIGDRIILKELLSGIIEEIIDTYGDGNFNNFIYHIFFPEEKSYSYHHISEFVLDIYYMREVKISELLDGDV